MEDLAHWPTFGAERETIAEPAGDIVDEVTGNAVDHRPRPARSDLDYGQHKR